MKDSVASEDVEATSEVVTLESAAKIPEMDTSDPLVKALMEIGESQQTVASTADTTSKADSDGSPGSWDDCAEHKRAYVSLLHGSSDHFFVYALTVGHCLKRLCQKDADRVLLCAGKWWVDRAARAALQRVYTHVKYVPLIHAPNATSVRRHEKVFSKIWALRLPYDQLVFLDTDLVVCADLSPLFDVPAPAGLHHGDSWTGVQLVHGEPINLPPGSWCANAGVMRLDPLATCSARRRQCNSMVHEIRQISHKTALPEQYYLADRIEGWRHLDASWNMEVGHQYDDPGYTWPRQDARRDAAASSRGRLWWDQDIKDVNVFHFSGTKLHPWWYCDLSPEETYQEAEREWNHRDPRRLIATALQHWRQALEEVTQEVATWMPYERDAAQAVLKRLRQRAASYRRWWLSERAKGKDCKRCQKTFMFNDDKENRSANNEGRWLTGWEGWWLCSDCIVGYVLSDEDPEDPQCVKCKGGDAYNGRWKWKSVGRYSTPHWVCTACL